MSGSRNTDKHDVGLPVGVATGAMTKALRLANSGTGSTYPNPSVEAVVVSRSGKVLAAARTGPTGTAHAEVRALSKAGPGCRDAFLFVTLEPCVHTGRTPPCTSAIIDSGIRAVVACIRDPAAHVGGKGIRALRAAGIVVHVGLLASRAREVHAHYLHHVSTGVPWVTLKAAASLDGQVACATGHSQWITGEPARQHAHRQRARHHAILVGRRTVEHDDPRLDVRFVRGVDPVAVVLDSRLILARSTPRVLRQGTLVMHGPQVSAAAVRRCEATGAVPIEVAPAQGGGGLDISAVLRELSERQIRSVLVEGGGSMWSSFVREGTWQELLLYQAPRLLGVGQPLLPRLGWERVDLAPKLRVAKRQRLGDDQLTVLVPR